LPRQLGGRIIPSVNTEALIVPRTLLLGIQELRDLALRFPRKLVKISDSIEAASRAGEVILIHSP
jgi:hypothetical protein